MASPCGRYQLVYNGEIYNHLELRAELEALRGEYETRLARLERHLARLEAGSADGDYLLAANGSVQQQDAEEVERLRAAAREAAARDARFVWTGPLPRADALRRLGACNLHLITSRAEGGSNVLSEAVALGVPTLTTAIDGSLGILGEDYPGAFPPGDAAALARALEQALASPAAPEPGRTHAAGYSWDRCAQEHADFLRELYDRKRAVRR